MNKFTLPDVSILKSKDEFENLKKDNAIVCVLYSNE